MPKFPNAVAKYPHTNKAPVYLLPSSRELKRGEARTWKGKGTCLGASLTWLIKCRHYGVLRASTYDGIRVLPTDALPIFMQAGYEQAVRNHLIGAGKPAVAGGLTPVEEAPLARSTAAAMGATAEFSVGGEMGRSFEESAFKAFDTKIDDYVLRTPSVNSLYCLILVPGHAMAIAYQPRGGCFLYEPDSGVYSYKDWTIMLRDLWDYLYNNRGLDDGDDYVEFTCLSV